MEEETKENREINFLMEKKDMAKQRMLICGSVLLDDTRTFCIDGELDPTFEELFMEETRLFLFVLKYVHTFEFMERNDVGYDRYEHYVVSITGVCWECTFEFKCD